uniref:Slow anion channel-associated 1b n=1 Tax=Polypodium vulgare TaxID=58048 RepID=A0A977NZV5_POLVU|nr:slow anion channel-associated 1b [Polypodium vulgare]
MRNNGATPERLHSNAQLACNGPVTYTNDAFLAMDSFANKEKYEREINMKDSCSESHDSDRLIYEKDVIQMSPQVKETPLPRSVEPLSIQQNDNPFEHQDSVVDISKLMAEGTSTQEQAKASEPYTHRSALSRRRSSSNPPGFSAELVKKVSFGSRTSPPATDGVPPPEPFQPPLHNHPQPPSKQPSKKKGFPQTAQSNSKDMVYRDDLTRSGDELKHKNYALFRTRSGHVERQLSRLQSRQQQEQQKEQTGGMDGRRSRSIRDGSVSAGRYFDALAGPELEILKDSEELLLPLDKRWPFLLRFPIGCFGICLGLASQAILWKLLATSPSMTFLHVHLAANFALWCLALTALVVIFTTYTLKFLLYFEAVRREFHHPVRVNFFFAPWIIGMFLVMGIPPKITKSIHPSMWCVFAVPLLILELKIYGQWLSGGQRRLSKVANPSTHLSLVGNFVAALLAAQIGWKEPAIFFWAVGCAHYLVLFVTLYQRLPTTEALPKELHPVFFLFVAAPSTASVAWKFIAGDFDRVSRIAYFIALFLYASLAVQVKFFCGFKFSIAWWAYTFPMTASAIATVHYSIEVRNPCTQVMAVTLSIISALMVMTVFISTILHGMWGTLFPNDIAIAITTRRNRRRRWTSATPSNKGSNDLKAYIVDGLDCFKEKSKNRVASLQEGVA